MYNLFVVVASVFIAIDYKNRAADCYASIKTVSEMS